MEPDYMSVHRISTCIPHQTILLWCIIGRTDYYKVKKTKQVCKRKIYKEELFHIMNIF